MSFITHIELSDGQSTWRIAASVKRAPSTVRPDVVITSYDGIMDAGELDEDPKSRSYSDGYVWNSNGVRKGKDMTLRISFIALSPAQFGADYDAFEAFGQAGRQLTLKTFGVRSRTYNCISRGIKFTDSHKGQAISCEIYLASKEAI